MTPAEMSQYLGLALAIIALLGHAKGYFSSGEKTLTARVGDFEKKMTARVDKAETKLVEYDRRIQALEGDFKHLPSKDDIHGLMLSVEVIRGELGKMSETHDGVKRAVSRIEGYLLEERPKA